MKRTLAFWGLLINLSLSVIDMTPVMSQSSPTSGIPAQGNGATAGQTRIYRDPRSGRWMKQELQMVDVPVTRWQRQWTERSVNTPQTTLETRLVPQTIAIPKTDQVLQTKIKNAWNPFAQPVYAYEHVPVTRFETQTQLAPQQVPVTRWVSRIEKVPVDQPVQTTEKQPRWVVSEISDPAAAQMAMSGVSSASSGRPLSSQWVAGSSVNRSPRSPFDTAAPGPAPLPASSTMQMAATPATPQNAVAMQARPPYTPPVLNYGSVIPSPTGSGQSNYRAPLNVATQPMGVSARDAEQAGLPPTIVR